MDPEAKKANELFLYNAERWHGIRRGIDFRLGGATLLQREIGHLGIIRSEIEIPGCG
jgi:hypothetical protein